MAMGSRGSKRRQERASGPTEPRSAGAGDRDRAQLVPRERSLRISRGPQGEALALQIASDLHIEFGLDGHPFEDFVHPSATVMALLGDIGIITEVP